MKSMIGKSSMVQQVHIQGHPPWALGWLLRFYLHRSRLESFVLLRDYPVFLSPLSEGLSFRSLYLDICTPESCAIEKPCWQGYELYHLDPYSRDIIDTLSIVTILLSHPLPER